MTGLELFPCRGKVPLTPHGFKDATADIGMHRHWERVHPWCNWATPIPAGTFVLDIDVHHDGHLTLAALETEHGALPATRFGLTLHGGQHRWFSVEGEVRQTVGVLGPGLDTRVWPKGYVLVAPSKGYRWADEGPIAPAPLWLVEALRPAPPVDRKPTIITAAKAGYGESALRSEVDRVRRCPAGVGQRNITLYVAARSLGELVGAGLLDQYRAAQALLEATSLPDSEARSTILSGLNKGASEPRQVAS